MHQHDGQRAFPDGRSHPLGRFRPCVPGHEHSRHRIKNAGTVMTEILNVPDDIPKDLLDKAECVIVLPSVLRFAIGFGGSYGRGVMTCRNGTRFRWTLGCPDNDGPRRWQLWAPVGKTTATDFVLLVMNPRGADSILSSKVKLGAGISAAAGPKGRDASAATDVTLRAEVLSYSRSRGLFAGMYLEGSTLRPDKDANKRIYGKTHRGERNRPWRAKQVPLRRAGIAVLC